jgi:hypothetical protein
MVGCLDERAGKADMINHAGTRRALQQTKRTIGGALYPRTGHVERAGSSAAIDPPTTTARKE